MTQPNHSSLAALPDSALWSSRAWADFARLKGIERHLAILPVFGLADWGLGRPLDLEETIGCAVLREALPFAHQSKIQLSVMPPLRFALGPYPHCAFGLDFETAHTLLLEIGASIKAAGFRRVVLFTTSPWNRELIDVGGRDMRVELGLQTFLINLASLGLDLHPVSSTTRSAVQNSACALFGTLPSVSALREDILLRDFRPGIVRQPGPLPFDRPLASAVIEGRAVIRSAAEMFAGLLGEIRDLEPLAAGGAIATARAPRLSRQHAVRATSRRKNSP